MKSNKNAKLKQYIALLKNNTSHKDNEEIIIEALSESEARKKLKFDSRRFSLVGIYPKPEKGQMYAW